MNQNPERIARDQIGKLLLASGWLVQSFNQKNIAAGLGVVIREYPTATGPAEKTWKKKEAVPVVYNQKLAIEFFDFIVIDECHQSIYNLWEQVLYYFDAFQIGMTVTPDNRTFVVGKESMNVLVLK